MKEKTAPGDLEPFAREGYLTSPEHSTNRIPNWTTVVHPQECEYGADAHHEPVACGNPDHDEGSPRTQPQHSVEWCERYFYFPVICQRLEQRAVSHFVLCACYSPNFFSVSKRNNGWNSENPKLLENLTRIIRIDW